MTAADDRVEVTPVLIVGGGPVGFALALDLAYQGIRSTLIERGPDTGAELLAKAGTLSARTVEFCRRWGIADEVAGWGADPDYPRDTCYVTSLNGGHLIGRDVVASAKARKEPHSPEMLRKCPQYVFDPLLARAVAKRGMTDVHYNVDYQGLDQDSDGVTVRASDGGRTRVFRASYVVGCDGAASRVRRDLGIPFEGPTLDTSINAMVRVRDLHEYHPIGKATRYNFVDTTGTWAALTSVDYGDLWRFTFLGAEAGTPDRVDLEAKIRAAFGRDDVPFELLRALPWRRSQCTARHFRAGRVLLAGDSAHTTSPTGGHGLNTGLQDVVGLGWVLAARLQGWGGERLLDAYETERRPVALRNGQSSTENFETWAGKGMDLSEVLDDGPDADEARARIASEMSTRLRKEWHADGIRMGYRYEGSPVIVPDGTPEPDDDPVTYVPTSRPGHRAPHAWLEEGRSVLDLFGHGFTLLRLGDAAPDPGNLVEAARSRGVPLQVHHIDDDVVRKLYERALVLVRPDGHVAWRDDVAPGPDDAAVLVDRVRGVTFDRGTQHD